MRKSRLSGQKFARGYFSRDDDHPELAWVRGKMVVSRGWSLRLAATGDWFEEPAKGGTKWEPRDFGIRTGTLPFGSIESGSFLFPEFSRVLLSTLRFIFLTSRFESFRD